MCVCEQRTWNAEILLLKHQCQTQQFRKSLNSHRAVVSTWHASCVPHWSTKPFTVDFIICMEAEVRRNLPRSMGAEPT